jgi:peptidoglycan/xylan/chitin deacetylase (PgdA/CDA1 family)
MRKYLFILLVLLSLAPLSLSAQKSQPRHENGKPNRSRPLGFFDGDPLPERTVYLTFDDGPTDFTEDFLDVLKRYDVRATFFLCARWAQENWAPNLSAFDHYVAAIQRMKAEGQCVGNHTADHQSFLGMTSKQVRREITKNQMLIDWAIGPEQVGFSILRPPFGLPWVQTDADCAAATAGIKGTSVVFMWTKAAYAHDSDHYVKGEWYTKAKTDQNTPEFQVKVKEIEDRILGLANGKSFVALMHDTHPTTLAALPAIIEGLKARGYAFATAEDWVIWRYGKPSAQLVNQKSEGK